MGVYNYQARLSPPLWINNVNWSALIQRQIENLEQFIQRVHKYKDLDELTPCGNLLREFILKLPARAAANGGRTSAFPMTLWAISRWMNWWKRKRHDWSHAAPAKIRYYFLTPPAICRGIFIVTRKPLARRVVPTKAFADDEKITVSVKGKEEAERESKKESFSDEAQISSFLKRKIKYRRG